ncbi:P(E)-nerolidol/(E,E)-geranyl linalool synthase, putative [Theobroma cacao]|uniref:P(E)-nerolidol/(E,E)-geranyl linalool synthase, putative n=1 Tax=Theobroma cacao TaxID=3641 RepID=A0A061GMK8_THECC|nr:P(E)-nerolidol/(E,E)-geranyl linalool synthase, putative [Theobroma cacao]
MLSDYIDPHSFVSPSAYDTAWLAMIPADSNLQPCSVPMFKDCLDWVLNNWTEEGYWAECDAHGNPTIESLLATLACAIVLKKWNVGIENEDRDITCDNGSLSQSPSATACAFMATGNKECLACLRALVRRCGNGVPPTYPMDEELIKLGLANQPQRLGSAEHFSQQIEDILTQVYR